MGSPVTQPGYFRGREPGNKGKTYPAEVLTPAEIRALLAAVGGRPATTDVRNRALLMTLYRSGLRISEALDLRPLDFDLEQGAIHVLRGKGGKRRTVGVDAPAVVAVREWLDARTRLGAPSGAPLFCTLKGGRLYPSYVRDLLHRLAQRAGLGRRIHPHMLRHTLASELAHEGVPMPLIQRQLGHRNLATTDRYLSSIAPQEVLDAIHKRTTDW